MEKSFGSNCVRVEPNCKWQCDIVMHNCNCDTAYRTSPIRPKLINISLSDLPTDEEGSCPRSDACELLSIQNNGRSNLRNIASFVKPKMMLDS